ncbi:MAG: DUF3105 domain-containing protein [Dehalococcoidia bacterium]|nr:DUF3105 domain-containing protein [Dehalococcoidia bacterium]
MVVGVLALTVVVLAVVAFRARPEGGGVSTAPLRGEEVTLGPATHVGSEASMQIPEGQPPAGGPHFASPLAPGVYDESQQDGFLIHSLEHGMIWISYRPDLLGPGDLQTLRKVAHAYSDDVVLSPRPANSAPVSLVSWGRRLTAAMPLQEQQLRDFVTTNRNRSPEPGVR